MMMQDMYYDGYSPSLQEYPSPPTSPAHTPVSPSQSKPNYRWYHCREEPFTVHKSVSEASMYRATSRFSLKSESMSSRTLDYLMRCFWVCSTGCHQTT